MPPPTRARGSSPPGGSPRAAWARCWSRPAGATGACSPCSSTRARAGHGAGAAPCRPRPSAARLVGAVAGAVGHPDHRPLETTSRELRFLEQVVEPLPSGVPPTDAQGRDLLQNAAGERILRERAPHHVQARDPSRIGLDRPASELPTARVPRFGEPSVREAFAIERPDGAEGGLAVHSGPVRDEEGERIAAVAAFEDVAAWQRTALALEEELRVRDRFMAVLGHDLRTPAAAILVSAQLLQRSGGLDPRQEQLVQRIVSSGRRMERMIRELLDMGSIRADRVRLAPSHFDLAALCEEVVSELRSAWPDRAFDLDLDPPATGRWDAERLAQVLSNLLGNALAHGRPEEAVRVRLRADEDDVELVIRNAAPPLSPDLVPHVFHLFQPFRAVERPSPHSGLGLGLFISHAIVSAHGGTIALESNGSEVVVTLRLPRDGAEAAPAR